MRLPAAALLPSLLWASPIGAAETGPPAPLQEPADPVEQAGPPDPGDGRRTLERLPINLGRNVVLVFSKDNLVPILAGGALTGVSFALDDTVGEYFTGGDRMGGLQSFGDKLGDAEVVVPLTAGLFVAGRIVKNQRFRDMSYDFAQAQIANGIYTAVLKAAVGRERPNGSNNHSFPSGHSSSWFTMARIVDHHYGPWIAAPTYLLWGITAASRLDNNSHFFSDVIGGAALGFVIARTAVKRNDEPLPGEGPRKRLTVSPWLPSGDRGLGVMVRLEF